MENVTSNNPVYIIIVTFNGEKWLHKCIESSLASDISVHIIIIDNGSTDHTLDIINSFPKEKIHLIKTGENLGFGKANNIGFEYAMSQDAQYVYLLNQDAYLESDTISNLKGIMDRNNHFGLLSPIQMNANKTSLDKSFADHCSENLCPGFLSDSYTNSLKEVYSIHFIMAAHWLISRDCLKKVGFFSSLFDHYGEDGDFTNRVLYAGYKVGICPNINVVHDREFRPMSKEKELYLTYVTALVFLADVNKNLTKKIKIYLNYQMTFGIIALKEKSFHPLYYSYKLSSKIFKIKDHCKKYKRIKY